MARCVVTCRTSVLIAANAVRSYSQIPPIRYSSYFGGYALALSRMEMARPDVGDAVTGGFTATISIGWLRR